jgi:hypothetical protein
VHVEVIVMRFSLVGLSIFFFTACTGNVQVGGPFDDGGSDLTGSDGGVSDSSSNQDATGFETGLTCQAAGGFCTGVGGCLTPTLDSGKGTIVFPDTTDCHGASTVCCTMTCEGDDNFDCCNGSQTNRPECVSGHVGCLPGFTQQPKGTCGTEPDGGYPYYDDAGSCPGTCSTPADIGCSNWYRSSACAGSLLCCVNPDGGTQTDGGAAALCTSTGGTVATASCCSSVSGFPNECLIGACSCAPSGSHIVDVCNCGTGKCFDPATGCR